MKIAQNLALSFLTNTQEFVWSGRGSSNGQQVQIDKVFITNKTHNRKVFIDLQLHDAKRFLREVPLTKRLPIAFRSQLMYSRVLMAVTSRSAIRLSRTSRCVNLSSSDRCIVSARGSTNRLSRRSIFLTWRSSTNVSTANWSICEAEKLFLMNHSNTQLKF